MNSYYEPEADKEYHLHFFHTDRIKIEAHFHKNVELLFLTDGELTLWINGKKMILHKGEGVFVRPYEVHAYGSEPVKAWTLVLSDSFLDDYRETYCSGGEDHFPHWYLSDKKANGEVMELLRQWLERGRISRMEIRGWINVVLSRIAGYYKPERYDRAKSDTFAVNALSYIEQHFKENIGLDELANEIGYSRNYCSALFKRYVGETFNDYLNAVRARAALSLIRDGKTVNYAIDETGFSSRATFYRACRKLEKE